MAPAPGGFALINAAVTQQKATVRCLARRSTQIASSRARVRSRMASSSSSGTLIGVSSPARNSLARAKASRRSFFKRSPGRRGIRAGAATRHSSPRAVRCR